MIGIRKADERKNFKSEKLDTYYSFSYGEYQDPDHNGFGPLRVINEDNLAPGAGFPMHAHQEVEVVSFVKAGALEYRDDQGNAFLLSSGDAQVASCGTGIEHSVYNHSKERPLAVYQFHLTPEHPGLPPALQHWDLPRHERRGRWRLLASRDGRDGSMVVRRDADVHTAILEQGEELEYNIRPGRHAWIQVIHGRATISGRTVGEGDGVAAFEEERLFLTAQDGLEVLLFDLA